MRQWLMAPWTRLCYKVQKQERLLNLQSCWVIDYKTIAQREEKLHFLLFPTKFFLSWICIFWKNLQRLCNKIYNFRPTNIERKNFRVVPWYTLWFCWNPGHVFSINWQNFSKISQLMTVFLLQTKNVIKIVKNAKILFNLKIIRQ